MIAGTEGQVPAARDNKSQITAAAVEVTLGTRRVCALVDTGADFSMVRDGLQGEIQRDLKCEMFPPARSARGAGRELLRIAGVLRDL